MAKKKIKDEIVITFFGNNSEHVTGSKTLVSVLNDDNLTRTNIVVDFGLIQGEGTVLDDYKANKREVRWECLNAVDYVFITHSHA